MNLRLLAALFVVAASAATHATAEQFDTRRLAELDRKLMEQETAVHNAFLPADATSAKGRFYFSVYFATNTVSYAAEEVDALGSMLSIKSVATDLKTPGFWFSNSAYRMWQICNATSSELDELVERNPYPGTRLEVARLAGVAQDTCDEIDALRKKYPITPPAK